MGQIKYCGGLDAVPGLNLEILFQKLIQEYYHAEFLPSIHALGKKTLKIFMENV